VSAKRPGPDAEGRRTLLLEGLGPVHFVRSRRARRLSVSVRASRGVRVAVPWRVSFEEARRLALTKTGWARRTQARIERARERCREAVLAAGRLDRRSARALLAGRLADLAAEHGFTYRRLSVRNQGTLWGSASVAGGIQLNAVLAVLPPDLADYVILHELVHLRHRGHGLSFWGELERLMPDARRRQKRLREYSLALF
jgi:predicted metal-dependent hydrolase